MSVLSKEIYEAKASYASRSNSANEEIMQATGVSQNVIDNILRIVSIRHEMHSSSRSSLFNTESADFNSKWEIVNELQEFVGETILDEFDTPLDTDWSMDLVNTDKFVDFQDFSVKSISEISDKIEKLNTFVEKKLKEIDGQYGTSWTPSGASRI